MTTARVFTSGTRQLNLSTPTTMYPFVTPQSVYAGTCGSNNPATRATASAASSCPSAGR